MVQIHNKSRQCLVEKNAKYKGKTQTCTLHGNIDAVWKSNTAAQGGSGAGCGHETEALWKRGNGHAIIELEANCA